MGTEMKKFFLFIGEDVAPHRKKKDAFLFSSVLSGTSKLIFNKKGTKTGIAVAIVTELREAFIDLHMYSVVVIVWQAIVLVGVGIVFRLIFYITCIGRLIDSIDIQLFTDTSLVGRLITSLVLV